MPASSATRFTLVITVVLTLFWATYEVAVRWPSRPARGGRQLKATRPARVVESVLAGRVAPVTPETPVTSSPVSPSPRAPRPVFERGSPLARRRRLVHRYVGTVGGQPATALLEWQNPDSITGSFYLHRQGPAYGITQPPPTLQAVRRRPRYHQRQVLQVTEQVAWDDVGEWQLHGRPGATLTATWRDGPTGRPQAVVLHETYAGAVRLAVQTWWVRGRSIITDTYGNVHSLVPAVKYEFLHLPAPATVPVALWPMLSPGPAARRQRLRTGGDFDCRTSYTVTVLLNDFGLLSYQYFEQCSPIAGGYSGEYHHALLDLVGGRWLTPESQLIAHYESALTRLLARRLLHEPAYRPITRDSNWRRQALRGLGARPDTLAAVTRWLLAHAQTSAEGALFTGAGLEIEDGQDVVKEAMGTTDFRWFIPYAELRPLVRPGTPLARLLQARGLWESGVML